MVNNGWKDKVKKVEDINSRNNKREEQGEVILFFSFDIVNSTQYKTENYYDWSFIIGDLFTNIRNRVQSSIKDAELWRILGDEAVFIARIKNEDAIAEYINIIYDIMDHTITDLMQGNIIRDFEDFSEKRSEEYRQRNILSLKAAAWIAEINRNPKNYCTSTENIFAIYEEQGKYRISEFLGNDIDCGFRISKFAMDRRLVISFELACILAKKTEELKNINIITYRKLKGIWKGRLYPIIWYHRFDKYRALPDTFYYDEIQENSIVQEYIKNHKGKSELFFNKEMFTLPSFALGKIAKDMGLDNKVERILRVIKSSDDAEDYISNPKLEFHCVAICYSLKENGILIIKRASRPSQYLDGIWEFGCAKANENESVIESITSEYRKDFGIKIKVFQQEGRMDRVPIVLSLYTVWKNNKQHKGIITLAEVDDGEIKLTDKHIKYQWIKETDVDKFCDDNKDMMVPDFKNTLMLAFQMYKSIREGEGKC